MKPAPAETARRKSISVMPLPLWEEMDFDTKRLFKTIDRQMERKSSGNIDNLLTWCVRLNGATPESLPRVKGLEHRLSDEMFRRASKELLHPRTPIEWGVIDSVTQRLSDFLAMPDLSFKDQACAMHAEIVGAQIGIRKTEIRSTPDLEGAYVVFPSPSVIEAQLSNLGAFIREHIETSASFTAATSMASICNIHPFTDANGRVSRLVFNGLLRRYGYQFYVPVHEIGRISRGGFLISMRLAQYRHDWLAFGRFLLNAIEFTQNLVSRRPNH